MPKPLQNHYTVAKPKDILTAGELSQMRFKTFRYMGDFKNLIGEPETNFKCLVSGKRGGGKSTFMLMWANYHARNFGKVLYNSNEEGARLTMQDKLKRLNITTPNLHISEHKNFTDLFAFLKANKGVYSALFIDSLTRCGMDAEQIRILSEAFPELAIIYIVQQTKEGHSRGSAANEFDVDIVIYVNDGIAVTDKNRFAPSPRTLKVFQTTGISVYKPV